MSTQCTDDEHTDHDEHTMSTHEHVLVINMLFSLMATPDEEHHTPCIPLVVVLYRYI